MTLLVLAVPTLAGAQNAHSLGTVAAADATVTAAQGRTVPMSGGRAQLVGASTVQASAEYSAVISLTHGGEVRACQTTVVHLSESDNAGKQSLSVALDRGALEIKRKAEAGDVLITPDLHFQTASAGPLDLRVRVVFEGDTCVENRGRHAPVLQVQDAFGESSYEVKPGQHVMFERGSLRQVDDRETTPCGCPPEANRKLPLADAALSGRPDGHKDVAAAHPFPAAESAGLALAPASAEPEKPDETHLQIATTLDYDPNAPAPPQAAPAATTASTSAPAAPQPSTPEKTGPLSAIGRFFERLFVH